MEIINVDIFSSPKDIYMFGKKLGHGSYGVVYEATHIRTQTQWAIKTVCKAEVSIMKWHEVFNPMWYVKCMCSGNVQSVHKPQVLRSLDPLPFYLVYVCVCVFALHFYVLKALLITF